MKQQNPAFYINTGDIIMGNTENENVIKRQFTDYLDALKNLGTLNFVAPGNHDVANNTSRKYFLEWIQKPALNNAGSIDIKAGAGLPGNELSGGNSQETANNEAQIENGSTKNSLYYYLEYKDYIRSLFAGYKVDGVFCGHEHFYNKQEHDGVQYIITGCSGASPYAPKDEGGFNHFLKMQIRAKSWTMDVIDSSGDKVYTEEILFN